MFYNMVPRRIYGPKSEEVTGQCRRPPKEELYDLYSTKIYLMIESRVTRWAGHVAGTGQLRYI
jgi:hypothetical protein